MIRKHIPCCLCGGKGNDLIGSGTDFEYGTSTEEFPVVRCMTCGLIFLQDRPDTSEFKTIYPRNYYSYSTVENELRNPSNKNSLAARFRKFMYQRNFRKVLDLLPDCSRAPSISILDIGCGDGRLLNWFREMDPVRHKTFGIDNDDNARRIVEGNGHHFIMGMFEELEWTGDKFDIIVSNHVIEHVADPVAFCRKARGLLRDGGIFSFDTPNVDSWDWKLLKERFWGGYHFPRHWTFFSRETAEALLGKAGMQLENVLYYPNPVFHNWSIHHLLIHSPRFGAVNRLKRFRRRVEELFPPVRIFHNSFHSFCLLAVLTVLDKVGQILFQGLPSNMKVIARAGR